jgi:hypothetical protein
MASIIVGCAVLQHTILAGSSWTKYDEAKPHNFLGKGENSTTLLVMRKELWIFQTLFIQHRDCI